MLPACQFPGLGDPPVITQAAGIPAQRSQPAADNLAGTLPRTVRNQTLLKARAHTAAAMDGSHFPPFICDRHTEQGSLCVLGRRRSGRNCCAHPPPATRRPERSGVGISGIPSLARRDVQHIDDPAPVSVRGTHPAAHRFPFRVSTARPASAVSRVAPARLTRAFSGPGYRPARRVTSALRSWGENDETHLSSAAGRTRPG